MSETPAGDLDFDVIWIIAGDHDGDIFGLQNRATNCPLGRHCTKKFYPLGYL